MFAVVKTGGKQYKVSVGDILRTEKIDTEPGQVVELTEVLAIENEGKLSLGAPFLKGAKVIAELVEQCRARKVLIFKKIRRHNHRRKNGHKQPFSVLRIKEIVQG